MSLPVPPWAAQPPEGAPTDDQIEAQYITDGDVDPYFDPAVPAWQITNDDAAEWAMAKAATATFEIDAVKDQANAWIERVKEWAGTAARRSMSTLAYFEARLEEYALTRRYGDDKAATLHLPSGVVRTRRNHRKAAVLDEEAVIAWAKQTDGPQVLGDDPVPLANLVVKTTEKIRLSELREFVEVTDVLDAFTVTFDDDAWTVVPIGDDGEPDMSDLTVAQVRSVVSVEPLMRPTVTYRGAPVPGMAVEHETVTASISPVRKEITPR